MLSSNTSFASNYTEGGLETRMCYFLDVRVERTALLFAMGVTTVLINAITSVTAVFGNVLIILAISRTPSLQTPSNTLLGCLASSDLVNGFPVQTLHVVYKSAEFKGNFDLFCTARVAMEVIGWVTAAVSFATLCAISVDKYLALYFHMRYSEMVTHKRLFAVIGIFWIFFAALSTSRFITKNTEIFTLINLSTMAIGLLLTLSAYYKIYKVVRRHEKQIHDQEFATVQFQSQNTLNMSRYKKSTKTMFCILGLFLLCYGPFLCVQVAYKSLGYSIKMKILLQFSGTLAFMNATFNPIVYCMRMGSLRRQCLKILKLRLKEDNRVINVTSLQAFPSHDTI